MAVNRLFARPAHSLHLTRPTGAGKTTLLDCLTGHRKSGLSGSIRFSSSPPAATSTKLANEAHALVKLAACGPANGGHCLAPCCLAPCSLPAATESKQRNLMLATSQRRHLQADPAKVQLGRHCRCQQHQPVSPVAGAQLVQGDNLKVSIIPQNDHLIGHLTVHETLNYASKLKNCLAAGNFDHKLNIKRVAQQLGLMSCLGTRINKLSGGQYKRVSIAQELLSSPDVLILDEPTSGLDAMTCFQTVQVLKKLTDDRRASGQKSIAVILTIHQPNSDVFQQFNHVYVVAQGGKCIYEGPPASIESVINRVGICLPNSYYNPATMIVEIAAGKFGQAAISKLNAIQRKQYGERAPLADEQNSTGDSAVDCPSSNCEEEEDDDDDDDGVDSELGDDQDETKGGNINAGFIMDGELGDEKDPNNNCGQGKLETDTCCVPLHAEVMVLGRDKQQLESAGSSAIVDAGEKLDRRKRRRRMRRRTGDKPVGEAAKQSASKSTPFSLVQIAMDGSGCGGGGGGDGDSGSDAGACQQRGEKRLKLNSLKADQKFPFWRHTYLHFHRSWLSIVRDPLLCSMQLALHIMVPVMVSLVYGTYVGKPNACPRAGPIDIMAYAMEPTDTALQLQEDLRTTLENIGYIFFKLYGIIFAAMTVTVLTFPLDMHVLVKEFRNGWYGLSSYFLGRTLADIPFQLTLPLLAMALSYYATGQPSSYLQWRFFSITAILILSSLIAQSQGLLFGAILMDKMKAAVFVAPAATTPIILFAGFLVRTQSIPSYLRPLSNLSYLRYAIEACLISRYGFNQCECDPAIFNQTVPELPPIARSMLDYWLSSYKPQEPTGNNSLSLAADSGESDAGANKPDLFTKLTDSLARANSFGRNITSCDQVVPYPMIDYDLKDEQLYTCFAILLAMLIFTRLLTFFIVCFKVKRKV